MKLTLYRQTLHVCYVSNSRVERIELKSLRSTVDFSGFLTIQITFYLWLL